MKAFIAILLTLILVVAQSGAATVSSVSCPQACCGCCAGGCAGRDCCIDRSEGAPQSQPAVPAPIGADNQLGPVLLATAFPFFATPQILCFVPTLPAADSTVVPIPLFRRDCTFLL